MFLSDFGYLNACVHKMGKVESPAYVLPPTTLTLNKNSDLVSMIKR